VTTTDSVKIEAPHSRGGLRPDWRTKAACRNYPVTDIDPWDVDQKARRLNPVAASFCDHCPVKQECLLAGLASDRANHGDTFMVYGGLTPWQRRALVRARHRVGCPVCHSELVAGLDADCQVCAGCGMSWRTRKAQTITPDSGQSS